jgi:ribonuclease G
VKEVVRQLRLRDIGGIIVIDFIDMANPKNRQAVEDAFRTELERDRTKTYVVEISPLGLVEMTRQNVTDGPREVMTRACPECGGDGIVVSDATVALQVERRLRALAAAGAGSRVQAYRVALHPRTLALVAGPGGARLAALEDATRRRFYLTPAEGHVHGDHFEVLAEGKREDLAPPAPVEEGAEIEVKLVEVDLHDVGAAVGKLDGVAVVVADSAKLVGKKTTVVVGRVLDGQILATPANGAEMAAPITFESEAEKPTRAPARRKAAEAPPVEPAEEAPTPEEAVETAEVVEPGEAAEGAEALEGADDAGDGQAPKKRTRRGSRGGRRRKKPAGAAQAQETPAADADASDGDEGAAGEADIAAAAAEPDTETAATPKPASRRRRTPKIHVPGDGEAGASPTAADGGDASAPADVSEASVTEPDDASADGEPATPARKRTRRGSRGGRSRKRKPAASANGDGASAPAAEAEGPPEAPEEAEPAVEPAVEPVEATGGSYVPMSEWIEDFDRRA